MRRATNLFDEDDDDLFASPVSTPKITKKINTTPAARDSAQTTNTEQSLLSSASKDGLFGADLDLFGSNKKITTPTAVPQKESVRLPCCLSGPFLLSFKVCYMQYPLVGRALLFW